MKPLIETNPYLKDSVKREKGIVISVESSSAIEGIKGRVMKKKEDVKQELHQHTDKNGVPFGKKHPIDAFHERVTTRCSHNITLLTRVILAKGTDGVHAADLKCKKYSQELPK